MPRAARKLKVGITGATSDLGKLLVPLLAADPRVHELVVFDLAKPDFGPNVRTTFRRVDLSRIGAEGDFGAAFEKERPKVLYHLALVGSRVHRADIAHEL